MRLGNGTKGNRSHDFDIKSGSFRHNPRHGNIGNVSHERVGRLRKSEFTLNWGFQVSQECINGTPTNNFSYSIIDTDVESVLGDGAASLLFDMLHCDLVSADVLKNMEAYKDAMSTYNNPVVNHPLSGVWSQKYDSTTKSWRGYIDVSIFKGFLARDERKKIYLE
jgi:hypothetical protein